MLKIFDFIYRKLPKKMYGDHVSGLEQLIHKSGGPDQARIEDNAQSLEALIAYYQKKKCETPNLYESLNVKFMIV